MALHSLGILNERLLSPLVQGDASTMAYTTGTLSVLQDRLATTSVAQGLVVSACDGSLLHGTFDQGTSPTPLLLVAPGSPFYAASIHVSLEYIANNDSDCGSPLAYQHKVCRYVTCCPFASFIFPLLTLPGFSVRHTQFFSLSLFLQLSLSRYLPPLSVSRSLCPPFSLCRSISLGPYLSLSLARSPGHGGWLVGASGSKHSETSKSSAL